MKDLYGLKNFDNSLKSYHDRKEHVEKVLGNVDLDSIIKNSICDDEYNMNRVESALEDLGTYLLKSKDIESERQIKNSFYRDEKRYREYVIGKKTFPTDFSNREDSFDINQEDVDFSEEYIFRLFDPEKITLKEKRKVLKIGIKEKEKIKNKYILDEIDNIFENNMDKIKSGKELLVMNYALKGMTDNEISIKIKIPRRTVSKIINRLSI